MSQPYSINQLTPDVLKLMEAYSTMTATVMFHANVLLPANNLGAQTVVNQAMMTCYDAMVRLTGSPEAARMFLHEVVDKVSLDHDEKTRIQIKRPPA